MIKKAAGIDDCPHCGGNRHLFRHAKSWRITCTWCGRFWRFAKDPRKGAQRTHAALNLRCTL